MEKWESDIPSQDVDNCRLVRKWIASQGLLALSISEWEHWPAVRVRCIVHLAHSLVKKGTSIVILAHCLATKTRSTVWTFCKWAVVCKLLQYCLKWFHVDAVKLSKTFPYSTSLLTHYSLLNKGSLLTSELWNICTYLVLANFFVGSCSFSIVFYSTKFFC